jgi:hypothetical protein
MAKKRRVRYFARWQIGRLLDCSDFDNSDWIGAPGYVLGSDGYVLGIKEVELDNNEYETGTLGIVFHSVRCAEAAAKFLNRNRISPKSYDQSSDEDRGRIKRDIIAALPW